MQLKRACSFPLQARRFALRVLNDRVHEAMADEMMTAKSDNPEGTRKIADSTATSGVTQLRESASDSPCPPQASLTRTNPKTLYGQKKPPARTADEVPRHYFRPERTTDRRGCLGWDLSIGHSP